MCGFLNKVPEQVAWAGEADGVPWALESYYWLLCMWLFGQGLWATMQWGGTEQWVVTDCNSSPCDDWGKVLAQRAGCNGYLTLTHGFLFKTPGQVAGQERVADSYLFFMICLACHLAQLPKWMRFTMPSFQRPRIGVIGFLFCLYSSFIFPQSRQILNVE